MPPATTHQPERPSHYVVRTHRHKLIHYYGLVREGRRPEDCWELYDLEADPQERQNRYGRPESEAVTAALKRRLAELRVEVGDTADPLRG